MEFVKKNFVYLIIFVLVVIIFIGRCSKPKVVDKPTIVHDTVWSVHDSIIPGKPIVVYIKPPKPEDIITYLPDTNYTKLKEQYNKLVILYLQSNIHKDTLKIDSLGYVNVTDTVSKNLIVGRAYDYNIKVPTVTTTITLPPKRKSQLYVGGGLQGSPNSLINQVTAGMLLKNRKDQIFGVYSGLNKDGQVQFGLQSYWKISFK